jgi:hypothetical protein
MFQRLVAGYRCDATSQRRFVLNLLGQFKSSDFSNTSVRISRRSLQRKRHRNRRNRAL